MVLQNNNYTAIILVGGQGTRLRPLTYTVPKPIMPFANRPILHILMDTLINSGVKRIILATSSTITDDIAVRKSVKSYQLIPDIEIIFSKENVPLGTAGAIGFARDLLKFPCIVLNADITCEPEIEEMMAQHIETGADATILATLVEDPSKYGVMEIEGRNVKKFWEKPTVYVGNRINAGVYIINECVMELIEGECSIERKVFPILAERNALCFYDHSGYWMDIGQAGDYITGVAMYLNTIKGNRIGNSFYFNENTELHKNGSLFLFHNPETENCKDENSNFIDFYSGLSEIDLEFIKEFWMKNLQSTTYPPIAYKSVIHPSALVGSGSKVGPYSVIGANVRIGQRVTIEESTIMDGCTIGDDVSIKNSIVGWCCTIESDVEILNTSVLGEMAEIGSFVTLDNECVGQREEVVNYKLDFDLYN